MSGDLNDKITCNLLPKIKLKLASKKLTHPKKFNGATARQKKLTTSYANLALILLVCGVWYLALILLVCGAWYLALILLVCGVWYLELQGMV